MWNLDLVVPCYKVLCLPRTFCPQHCLGCLLQSFTLSNSCPYVQVSAMPPSMTEHKILFRGWLQVPQFFTLVEIPGWKTTVLPHHLPACGFLNLQAAMTTILAMVHFSFDLQEKIQEVLGWVGQGERVNRDKERVTYCTLTLTVYWPGKHWSMGSTELQIWWTWLCSRIWT